MTYLLNLALIPFKNNTLLIWVAGLLTIAGIFRYIRTIIGY